MTSFASVWGRVGVGAAVAALGGASFLFACAEKTDLEEDAIGSGLTKGTVGAVNGDADYCNNLKNLCVAGEGDCDANSQCTGGAVCAADNGPNFGMPVGYDVCVLPHCQNKVRDADETFIDCGGVDCGSNCAWKCTSLPANGTATHCSADCPCPNFEGDCDSDAECAVGLKCVSDVGPAYGWDAATDVCEYAHCRNRVLDGDETGLDCGGSCLPCGSSLADSVRLGGAGADLGQGIAVRRGTGEYVVASRFYGSASYGGSTFTAVGQSDIVVAKYSFAGAHLWSKAFGSVHGDGDLGVAVAVGPSGQVAVVGNYGDAMTVSPGVTLNSISGSYDGFIVVYDTNGNYLWSRSVGGSDLDKLLTVTFDADGSVAVGGAFKGTADYGEGPMTSAGDYDAVIAKFSSTGTPVFSVRWGGTGLDAVTGLVKSTDNYYRATGVFRGVASFGTTSLTSAGLTDFFVTKVNPTNGATIWLKQFGGTSNDKANAIAVGGTAATANEVLVAGAFGGTVDFGAGAVSSAGEFDAFVMNLKADGTLKWVKTGGGTASEEALAVASTTTTGEVVVAGHVSGTSSNLLSASYSSAGGTDLYFARYLPSDGTLVAGSGYGSVNGDKVMALAATANDAVMATGFLGGNATLGTAGLVVSGTYDAFVTKVFR